MTISEFARQLGISTATVSRAFTTGARIHPETRARILAKAEELGYAPNPNARNLARRHSRLIGLDFPANADMLADLYLIELARGMQAAAQGADYGLLMNTLPRPGGDIELLREWVFGRAVDGVVIVVPPEFPLETLCPFVGKDVPCVLITEGQPSVNIGLPTVNLDLTVGARTALTHLRRLGHERIGFITSSREDSVYSVFRQLMQAENLLDPTCIVDTESSIGHGRAAMHLLLAAPIRPTAVFCRTDILALGALRAVKDMGLSVPGDISLIGHDDIALTELSDPALTTLRVDTAQIGRLATELMMEALSQGEQPATPRIATVGTELIVRASTAPVVRAVVTLSSVSETRTSAAPGSS